MVRGRKNGELLLYLSRVSVWDDYILLEVDCGDGYMTLRMRLMPLNCTLKNVYDGKSYIMCVLL